jgi:hypothetical protein
MQEVPPRFFVPAATPDTQESTYSEFARWCGRSVPPPGERVYSIVFKHDGDVWTATVGETLRGVHNSTHKVRGNKVERSKEIGDTARVLAIFPGDPFMVVTDHRIAGNFGSRWENPFLAGKPQTTTYFSDLGS